MTGGGCMPPMADQRYEFHWLEFRGEFMVWRWHKEGWASIHTQARFTPAEIANHGWRYAQAWPPPAAIRAAGASGYVAR